MTKHLSTGVAAPIGAAALDEAGAPLAPSSCRRRFWELPTQAHELLLAMTFTPEALRREMRRTMGQVHKARCKLDGRDVDLLYAAVHEATSRNSLSEALHKRLHECHALASLRWRALRGSVAFRAAWHRVREADTLPGELWALLTHPQGAEVEAEALYDARAWVFHHARGDLAQRASTLALQQRVQAAEQALNDGRVRAALQQQRADADQRRLREELAVAVGEAARWRSRLGSLQVAAVLPAVVVADARAPAADGPPSGARRDAGKSAAGARRVTSMAESSIDGAGVASNRGFVAAPDSASPAAPKPAQPIDGHHVLCVGGIRHAVARYRSRVERRGARFEHHDGGIEDGLHGLDGRLHRADLVICQAACINHEAYHRIKRHCERTGKPCLYLGRPSLSHLERALSAWTPRQATARSAE